ncbi:MAG: hypothetical protein JNK85_17895 [Verrucomicrobiales bacterium]|nr:hypothetical protein [Verrucomicrobiales bacterium]
MPTPACLRLFPLLGALGLTQPQVAAADAVQWIRVPEGGIQPQAVLDPRGTLHLLYFKGEASAGDLFYVRRDWKDDNFSPPVPVNHRRGSVMATGTIRGGQLAVGKGGRVHVAWNGPAPKGGDHHQAPMLYTRLTVDGRGFEPERDVISRARGLDGGGSVAADANGNVWVVWHAPVPGTSSSEQDRAVFVAHSTNDGGQFGPERRAVDSSTGACGCCGLKTFADAQGNLFISYRAARDTLHRDQTLLFARAEATDFQLLFSHPWEVGMCPMSSTSFSPAPTRVLTAWESTGNVYFARLDPRSGQVEPPAGPLPGPTRKHPIAVGNGRDQILLTWTEGTAWGKGGEVAWQMFSGTGKPTSAIERAPGLPAWSLVAAVALPNHSFLIIY